MEIKWLGHSCFVITSESGSKLMMDPPDPQTGYNIKPETVDAVTSSHAHHDHAYFELAEGNPVRITDAGIHKVKDMTIEGFMTFHDNMQGAARGNNIMYAVDVDGIRLLHAGDLGHIPDEATIKALGRIDVLLIPVGGYYTLDVPTALKLCNIIYPKIVIPMHYKTADVTFELGSLVPFLEAAKDCSIHRMRQPELTLTPESLGKDRIIVLQYDDRRDE